MTASATPTRPSTSQKAATRLTDSTLGSYWNLAAPYAFAPGLSPGQHVHQSVDPATQEPTRLQLGYFTPRAWLEQGKSISVKNAPTAFGSLSYTITSDVTHHDVQADVQVPSRDAISSLSLRLREPSGLRMMDVHVNGHEYKAFDPVKETVELSGLTGTLHVDVRYAPRRAEPATARSDLRRVRATVRQQQLRGST